MADQKNDIGWRYNKIQRVIRSERNIVDGMLLFYACKDKEPLGAGAFLLHE